MINNIIIFIINFIDKYYHQKRIFGYLKRLNIKIKIIYDIGSHVCEYGILFSKIYAQAKIFCFEANPNLIKKSKNNIRNNKKIKLLNLGIGNKNISLNFNLNLLNEKTSSFFKVNKNSKNYKIKKLINNHLNKETKIKMITLDKFISSDNPCPDLIKIDVEGYEKEVLLGIKNNLNNVKIILIEFRLDNLYQLYNNQNIHTFLLKNNFYLIKKFKFPILSWEDRLYINTK
jgi:FkbM family methyltransferase